MACFVSIVLLFVSISASEALDLSSILRYPALVRDTISESPDALWDLVKGTSKQLACKWCHVAAKITDDKDDQLISELVEFHCLKSYSDEIFILDANNTHLMSRFDANAPFGFLLHGFVDSFPGIHSIRKKGWMKHAIIEWSMNGVNVCAVNWGKLSLAKLNYFTVSQKNTVRVANYLVDILLKLEWEGADLTKATLAGHSLGAHIAGEVGLMLKNMDHTLGAIFGMDPAGPCYDCTSNVKDRLDESDANYVQCIHSNSRIFGSSHRCGCSDIYVKSNIMEPFSAHILSYVVFDWTLNANHRCAKLKDVGIHSEKVCGVHEVTIE